MIHDFTVEEVRTAIAYAKTKVSDFPAIVSLEVEAILEGLPERPPKFSVEIEHSIYTLRGFGWTDEGISEWLLRLTQFIALGGTLESLQEYIDSNLRPENQWQVCTFEDIRKGDRVKTYENGVTTIYDHPVKSTHQSNSQGRYIAFESGKGAYLSLETNLYRIPAPVQHPDPAEHPVIANVAVEKPGTNSTHRYDYATWDAEAYYLCWNNDGKYYGGWEPSTITEWEPAGVAPKVVADDE